MSRSLTITRISALAFCLAPPSCNLPPSQDALRLDIAQEDKALSSSAMQAVDETPERRLRVFVLAGQSNMVGSGIVKADSRKNDGKGTLEYLAKNAATKNKYAHLIDEEGEWKARDDVWISLFDRTGMLNVGYGAHKDAIGPELGFGSVVGNHYDDPVLLIKVAWGGKAIGKEFRSPSAGGEVGESYTAMIAEVKRVMNGLDKAFPKLKYDKTDLLGIGWHQGWNDRVNQAFNDAYEENLSCLIRDVRKELEMPELPFVIAETGMSGYEEKHPRAISLMKAQASVAKREEFQRNVAFVGTKDFWRSKNDSPSGQAYHWNNTAETFYLIGESMGQAMLQLVTKQEE
ncbi:MAG: sialate O-acetylesterase [Planctomycetes bacterium]|nr:sialate O-acetylesterase [Planctomycetota bacterium]